MINKPNLVVRLGLFFMQMWYNRLRYIDAVSAVKNVSIH